MGKEFSHFDHKGNAVMVDVSGKEPTFRTAVATGYISVGAEIMAAVTGGRNHKNQPGYGTAWNYQDQADRRRTAGTCKDAGAGMSDQGDSGN